MQLAHDSISRASSRAVGQTAGAKSEGVCVTPSKFEEYKEEEDN